MDQPINPEQDQGHDLELAAIQANQISNALRLVQGSIHEINNDLGPLVGYLSIMEYGAQAEPRFVGAMQESVQRLQDHLRRISDHIKPEGTPNTVRSPLSTLVEDILSKLRGSGFFRRVSDELVLGPSFDRFDPPWVEVCPDAFAQVFTNLLCNAMDAAQSPQSAGAPRVVRVELRANPDKVQVEVQDFGEGFVPTLANRVFDPFFTTRSGQHLGLGLTVARTLTKRMQGELELISRPGLGTRALLTLNRI